MTFVLTENEAYIAICFFYFKKSYESQNELSRWWAKLTGLKPNTYYHSCQRILREFDWIIEISETDANKLYLNEETIEEIYNSKVKLKEDYLISFYTFTYIRTFIFLPKLSIKEKKIFIKEIFDYCSEFEIEAIIRPLEYHSRKNISAESFLVNYSFIVRKITDLSTIFHSIDEFNNPELREFVKSIKNKKLEEIIIKFLKNRIEKSAKMLKLNNYQRNLFYLKFKDLLYNFQNDNSIDEGRELSNLIREIFNDGRKNLNNLERNDEFLSFLDKTIELCLRK